MKLLVTGRGTSGSFQIRGVQLGAAIGATVEREAAKVREYDMTIIVKRAPPDLLHRLRQAGAPIVWDIVDAFPQPSANDWTHGQCLEWLRVQVATLRPVAIVAATQTMAADCAEFGLPVLWLPHHARPGQKINPIRDRVQKVGYEGGAQYLGRWRAWLESECAARGCEFVVNPAALADVDIVVAVREATGYAPRHWKSGVKLANAQGSGTPCVVNCEAGSLEIMSGAELFADTEKEMADAISRLETQAARRWRAVQLLAKAPKLEDVAATYRAWLSRVALAFVKPS